MSPNRLKLRKDARGNSGGLVSSNPKNDEEVAKEPQPIVKREILTLSKKSVCYVDSREAKPNTKIGDETFEFDEVEEEDFGISSSYDQIAHQAAILASASVEGDSNEEDGEETIDNEELPRLALQVDLDEEIDEDSLEESEPLLGDLKLSIA